MKEFVIALSFKATGGWRRVEGSLSSIISLPALTHYSTFGISDCPFHTMYAESHKLLLSMLVCLRGISQFYFTLLQFHPHSRPPTSGGGIQIGFLLVDPGRLKLFSENLLMPLVAVTLPGTSPSGVYNSPNPPNPEKTRITGRR